MINKLKLILLSILFCFSISSLAQADFQEKLIKKIKTTNTLSFDFIQKIGEKKEIGNCYIKYPLLMKCKYPKKKKTIIANGKKIAIVQKRYKKIYYYPLKKTPLFYLLNKENIINLIQNNEPTNIDSKLIEYESIENNSKKIKIFFSTSSLDLLGWKTIDAYSNEVTFLITNIKLNIFLKENFFVIPNEGDL